MRGLLQFCHDHVEPTMAWFGGSSEMKEKEEKVVLQFIIEGKSFPRMCFCHSEVSRTKKKQK